jgi:hypothetical protein
MKRRTEIIIRCIYVAIILYGIVLVVRQLVALYRPATIELGGQLYPALTFVDSRKDKSTMEQGVTEKVSEKK